MTKVCTHCLMEKPLEKFSFADKKNGYRKSRCKECISIIESKEKGWRKRRGFKGEERKSKYQTKYEYHIHYTYNLSLEDYDNLKDRQNGECAICGQKNNLVVDHCHTTGNVRGLLCQKCNKGIGMLGDTKESLEKAFKYLSRF